MRHETDVNITRVTCSELRCKSKVGKMQLWDFVRNIFGGGNSKEPPITGYFDHQNNDNFINPIWQDDENAYNIRPFGESNRFNIFSDPLQMAHHFISQIDHMLSDHVFDKFMFGFGNEGQNIFTDAFPFASPPNENLRDKMLKSPNHDMLSQPALKLDTDLDGKITPDNFSNVWDKQNEPNSEELRPFTRITGRSVMKEYVRGPDGIIKQKQVIRDHEGNEETIISEKAGEKMYTVVIKKDKNGVETKTENFYNTNESDLTDGKDLLLKNDPTFNHFNVNLFLWKNFFNPNPKL
ncbi:uncharacterized protein LOC114879907 [Osmia bicornis bicornis]|uniref:uncharacterized protein LOC114879907 n=1 Tax=Osmia bicornis bicornis TaxID=1437191 RepID=UPI001EAEBD0E|nr:uncharacterized protein LOC114879907 [Osmia bicornis bicornis]XP_029051144.2 uncharacterized protein LOC114879907 [Osmia bicornis bicornis]XP_029051145.2 uncharacterized protein LOC114879907 [Osmia bicornis bicornis]